MAFRCEVCKTAQPPSTQPIKLVTKTRKKEYLQGGGSSFGNEIVQELGVCKGCSDEITQAAA